MTKKILLVEDDALLNQLYLDLLKEVGYSVELAVNGEEAYNDIKSNEYDLILLDMMMPIMTGLEVLEKLHGEKVSIDKKNIVFLTNSDNPKDIEAIRKVSKGYLLKSSMTPDQFVDKVKSYL